MLKTNTMFGDPLYDVATAWIFGDMYDELGQELRARLLPIVLDRLGRHVRGKLYRYVLLYSFLGANAYSPDCEDGHYRWWLNNLNDLTLWEGIA